MTNALLNILPGGRFEARPDTVSATEGEIELLSLGQLEQTRTMQIINSLESAMYLLSQAEPQGSC